MPVPEAAMYEDGAARKNEDMGLLLLSSIRSIGAEALAQGREGFTGRKKGGLGAVRHRQGRGSVAVSAGQVHAAGRRVAFPLQAWPER